MAHSISNGSNNRVMATDRCRRGRTHVASCATLWLGAMVFLPVSVLAADGPKLSGKTDSGIEYGLSGLMQYDLNRFHDEASSLPAYQADDAWRRAGLGFYIRKPGKFDVLVDYDLKADIWLDAYVRVETGIGSLRAGQLRTPVGLDDGATSSGATTFLERASPQAMVHEGRRIGVDWARSFDKKLLLNLAYFDGGDLDGANEGNTWAARAVYTPSQTDGKLLHFGLSGSRERRDLRTARVRVRQEASLGSTALVDSRTLRDVDAIDRYGAEFIWRSGPYAVQAEWLRIDARQDHVSDDVRGDGGYVQGSWMITGETRPYRRTGGLHNPTPSKSSGAVELALRYSDASIDAPLARYDRQDSWTVGLNWYLGKYTRLMTNYVHTHAEGPVGDTALDTLQVRAQLSF